MRARQNHLYKEGGTEIGSVSVGKDEWEYHKPQVACKWPLQFPTPLNWVGHNTEWTRD